MVNTAIQINQKFVAKVNFSVSLEWKGMCQYLLARSNVEKNFACKLQKFQTFFLLIAEFIFLTFTK